MTGNVVQLFFDAAERRPGHPAFVSALDDTVTFAGLRARVERFAGGLRARGFGPGDRAVFMLPMSVNLYVGVLGALAAGGIAVFVDPWLSVRDIARLAGAARPRAFLGTPKAHVLRLMSSSLRRVPLTIATPGPLARFAARWRMDEMGGTGTTADVPEDAPALVTYTTGSSGNPKGVNRTHGILAAQHRVIREEYPAQPDDVDLTTFPVFALSNLAEGITTVIPRVDLRRVATADPRPVLDDMRRFGVSTAAASPPLFDVIAAHVQATSDPAPALRRIVTGGAPVSDAQLRAWRQTWPATEIIVAFGSSEAEPVASMTADERLSLAGTNTGFCVGKPVAAVQARVVPISGAPLRTLTELSPGSIGELVVTGAHVCKDYAGDQAAFAETKVRADDGLVWHRMGDTGYLDERGRFWLVGRVHSTIHRQGKLLHAQVIEGAARANDPRIRRVAAVGVPDPDLGERLVIVVESDAATVVEDVRERLAALGLGDSVDRIVRTASGIPVDPRHNSKVDYRRVRAMLAQGALR